MENTTKSSAEDEVVDRGVEEVEDMGILDDFHLSDEELVFADPSAIQNYRESGLLFEDMSTFVEYRRSNSDAIIIPDEPLPSSVANLVGLPPIGDQGAQGSCTAWAWGYYCLSHQIAAANGFWDTSVPSHQFSPAYIYNQINYGDDSGSSMMDASQLTESFGCATLDTMPYSDSDCVTWPSEAAYTEAMSYRTVNPSWDYLTDDNDLAVLKEYLAAGNTAIMAIYVRTAFYGFDSVNNVYTTSHASGNLYGGHAVCIVGYDDAKATSDGQGAFLLVNSWGTDWGDSGFWWMSYEAMKDPLLSRGYVYYCDVVPQPHAPDLVGSIRISHEKRGDVLCAGLRVILEVNGHEQHSEFLNIGNVMSDESGEYQNHPFPGNHIMFDLSDFVPYLSTYFENEFVLEVGDCVWPVSGTLESFSVHSYEWNIDATSTQTPLTIQDNGAREEVSAFLTVPTVEIDYDEYFDTYVGGTVNITGTVQGESVATVLDTGFEPGSFENPWYTYDANPDNGVQLWGVDNYHDYSGGSSIWCGGNPSTTAVYTEHFIMPIWYWPAGWSLYSSGSNTHQWYPTGTSTQYKIEASTGGMSDVVEWAIQGPLDRSTATELCLTFWMDYEVDDAQSGNFASVLYSTDGSVFHFLKTWTAPVGESVSFIGEQEIMLPDDAICSTLYFAFIFKGDYTGSMTIDDIDIWDISSEYETDADSYVYSYVDLSDYDSAVMSFDYWADLETGFDWFYPGYYVDSAWVWPTTCGSTTGWEHMSMSVPVDATRVGFRFLSDSSVVRQGVYVDNVQLIGLLDAISSVEIFIDGISKGHAIASGTWSYVWNTTTYTEEEHDVVVTLDFGGNLYSDNASYIVDNTAPVLVSVTQPYQRENFTIEVFANDLGGAPIGNMGFASGSVAGYLEYVDGTMINATTYHILLFLSSSIPNDYYEFELYVTDLAGNTITVPMFLTVDSMNPVVSTPVDFRYEVGETGNSIAWTCSDANPSHYELTLDGVVISSGAWTTGLVFPVDGLLEGTHTYTITFWDLAGNSVSDTVIVTVTADAITTTSTTTSTSTDSTSTTTDT
ncbi:MAG: hypothetical protein DRP09_17520, partial [Candidatus Thorarchaeota archaeon]